MGAFSRGLLAAEGRKNTFFCCLEGPASAAVELVPSSLVISKLVFCFFFFPLARRCLFFPLEFCRASSSSLELPSAAEGGDVRALVRDTRRSGTGGGVAGLPLRESSARTSLICNTIVCLICICVVNNLTTTINILYLFQIYIIYSINLNKVLNYYFKETLCDCRLPYIFQIARHQILDNLRMTTAQQKIISLRAQLTFPQFSYAF